MRVVIFSYGASPGLATVAHALRLGGASVRLYTREEQPIPDNEHADIYPTLRQQNAIEMRELGPAEKEEVDLLLVGWSHRLVYTESELAWLQGWLAQARRVVLLYASQWGTPWQFRAAQIHNWWKNRVWMRQLDVVLYMLEPPGLDCFALLFRCRTLAVGPNFHHLLEEDPPRFLYAPWEPERARRYRLLASGTRNSDPWRVEILAQLEGALRKRPDVAFHTAPMATQDQGIHVLWSFDGPGLSLKAYLEIVTDSDFILCIPGTAWTHRPFESLARGAIPILDARNARMHDIPWRDGENCLLVPTLREIGDWKHAMERALNLTQERVLAMRRNVASLRDSHLAPDAFASRVRRRLEI